MFGKKKASDNPEVQEVVATADELIADVHEAVDKVDALLKEYEEAEKGR